MWLSAFVMAFQLLVALALGSALLSELRRWPKFSRCREKARLCSLELWDDERLVYSSRMTTVSFLQQR